MTDKHLENKGSLSCFSAKTLNWPEKHPQEVWPLNQPYLPDRTIK